MECPARPFARAWAQLGTAYGFLLVFDAVAPDTTLRAARVAISRALRLDSLGAEAHAASGLVMALTSHWEGALAAYQRAIELDPNYAGHVPPRAVHARNAGPGERRDGGQPGAHGA